MVEWLSLPPEADITADGEKNMKRQREGEGEAGGMRKGTCYHVVGENKCL